MAARRRPIRAGPPGTRHAPRPQAPSGLHPGPGPQQCTLAAAQHGVGRCPPASQHPRKRCRVRRRLHPEPALWPAPRKSIRHAKSSGTAAANAERLTSQSRSRGNPGRQLHGQGAGGARQAGLTCGPLCALTEAAEAAAAAAEAGRLAAEAREAPGGWSGWVAAAADPGAADAAAGDNATAAGGTGEGGEDGDEEAAAEGAVPGAEEETEEELMARCFHRRILWLQLQTCVSIACLCNCRCKQTSTWCVRMGPDVRQGGGVGWG